MQLVHGMNTGARGSTMGTLMSSNVLEVRLQALEASLHTPAAAHTGDSIRGGQ